MEVHVVIRMQSRVHLGGGGRNILPPIGLPPTPQRFEYSILTIVSYSIAFTTHGFCVLHKSCTHHMLIYCNEHLFKIEIYKYVKTLLVHGYGYAVLQ